MRKILLTLMLTLSACALDMGGTETQSFLESDLATPAALIVVKPETECVPMKGKDCYLYSQTSEILRDWYCTRGCESESKCAVRTTGDCEVINGSPVLTNSCYRTGTCIRLPYAQ